MSVYSREHRVQDRTYTSIMEDYLRAVPIGTGVTKKMLEMHGVPPRLSSTYMHFFVKWGVAKWVENSDPKAIVYTPHSDRRSNKKEWVVQMGEGSRPRKKSNKPEDDDMNSRMTSTGNELKVVEPQPPAPEPEKVLLEDLTLNEVREAMKLLLKEFGLGLYRKGGEFRLEPR